jgi:hypothetical protein
MAALRACTWRLVRPPLCGRNLVPSPPPRLPRGGSSWPKEPQLVLQPLQAMAAANGNEIQIFDQHVGLSSLILESRRGTNLRKGESTELGENCASRWIGHWRDGE